MDRAILEPEWKVEKSKIINGNSITRIEGENGEYAITNAGYITYEQSVERFKKRAEDEMWTKEKTASVLGGNERLSAGGVLSLYIERLTVAAGNFKYFTIILKDSSENELHRADLTSKVPEVPGSSELWTNYKTYPIPVKLKGLTNLYIIDAVGETKKYKFQFRAQ